MLLTTNNLINKYKMGNHEICCNINHGLIRCETPFTKEFNIEEEKYQNFSSDTSFLYVTKEGKWV